MADEKESAGTMAAGDILFPNGNRAAMASPEAGAKAGDILQALDLKAPKAVILLVGEAEQLEPEVKSRLVQLLSRGVCSAAAETQAVMIDGASDAAFSKMMGKAVADRGRKSSLIGLEPEQKAVYPGKEIGDDPKDAVELDPNHSHFVLFADDEWRKDGEMLCELAEFDGAGTSVIAVLVNGGERAKDAVLECVRRNWTIFVIEGSGGLADKIADIKREKPAFVEDAEMAELIDVGRIQRIPVTSAVSSLERTITRHFHGDVTLKLAWERFALYDYNAGDKEVVFSRLQNSILIFGVLATLLALTQAQLRLEGFLADPSWMKDLFRYIIVLVPILISILLTAANRSKAGYKWIMLRSSAEAIKREIFRYRTRASIYSDQKKPKMTREGKLARKLKSISGQMMQSEVNTEGLERHEGPLLPKFAVAAEDDGMSFLTPDQYLKYRLEDQFNYYSGKTVKLERKQRYMQWLIYALGGLGTLLAALGFELWIALTTALVGAFTAFLEYKQLEHTIITYNQAATDLANIQAWWTALPEREQSNPKNIGKLVDGTEGVLQNEFRNWMKHMEDMLDELQDEQEEEQENSEKS